MLDISVLDKYMEHKFFGVIAQKVKTLTVPQIQEKVALSLFILDSDNIDLNAINKLGSDGIFDECQSLRSLCWKLQLGYIGTQSIKWESEIDEKRNKYSEYKAEFTGSLNLSSPPKKKTKKKKKNDLDHPLSITSNSQWNQHFQDITTVETIEKDIKRTRNEMSFFDSKSKNNPKETNGEVLRRILFIYARLHPDVNYVQGLNELLAPIYYCFSNDSNPYFTSDIEADTFFCFESLLEQVKNVFIKSMDETELGIETKLIQLRDMLREFDREIYDKLNECQINYHYFAFQWITLIFTQSFLMPDILRLWDIVLGYKDKFRIIFELCVSILKTIKNEILFSDFAKIMSILQSLQSVDNFSVNKVIKTYSQLKDNFIKYFNK